MLIWYFSKQKNTQIICGRKPEALRYVFMLITIYTSNQLQNQMEDKPQN